MYLGILNKSEQEQIVQALRGPQFDRKRHGGLWDRGSADSYYSRPQDPHWYPEGSYNGTRIDQLNEHEIVEYLAGYEHNERHGGKKGYD
jgi:hypothetical protein